MNLFLISVEVILLQNVISQEFVNESEFREVERLHLPERSRRENFRHPSFLTQQKLSFFSGQPQVPILPQPTRPRVIPIVQPTRPRVIPIVQPQLPVFPVIPPTTTSTNYS